MDLNLDYSIAEGLKSNRQITRVVTESWVKNNIFCPICGCPVLSKYKNNMPVADFCCDDCKSDFELKSRESAKGMMGKKIPDGAYGTMIERIQSLRNPNFLLLTYDKSQVSNLLLVPNHFFVPNIIEKRKPLAETARRAGWVGCNILYHEIPESGKIFIIKNSREISKQVVLENYRRTESLYVKDIDSRGWVMDVLACVDRIPNDDFSLQQVYLFAGELQRKHPNNNFVKDKIRQQLQMLRDKGFIEFKSRGMYRKISF